MLMDAYELVEAVRKQPKHFLRSDKSLKELHAIMVGYELGAKHGIFSYCDSIRCVSCAGSPSLVLRPHS